MKRTIENLLKKTATAALLAATLLAIPATTFAAEREWRDRDHFDRDRGHFDRDRDRDWDHDRDRDRFRGPAVVVRPEVRFGYRPAYVPPPRACGFYDRWGYWHADPGCYAPYYGAPRW